MGIVIGKGNIALYAELREDGGVKFIALSDEPTEGSPAEVCVELDQIDELIAALQRLRTDAHQHGR